jgi:hypothetical protein
MDYTLRFETLEDMDEFAAHAGVTRLDLQKSRLIKFPGWALVSRGKVKALNEPAVVQPFVKMPRFTKVKNGVYDMKISIPDDEREAFLKSQPSAAFSKKTVWIASELRYGRYSGCYYTSEDPRQNQYPIYIPSKGRATRCHTAKYFLEIGLKDFKIVVEPQEYDEYAENFPEEYLLKLDMSYKNKFDYLDEYGTSRSTGSGPARNFIWDHSISRGAKWHWIIDDNVRGFFRFAPGNWRIDIKSPVFFPIVEDFITQSDEIAIGSMNYSFFCDYNKKPLTSNTRMYSILLIRNEIPFRWAGRYNEDSILSMHVLKAGWKTTQLNWFLGKKACTQTVKGGNEEIYKNGTKEKSEMFHRQFPNEVELVERFGRDHHYVDWVRLFPDEPKYQHGPNDEYGLYLKSDIRPDIWPQCLI